MSELEAMAQMARLEVEIGEKAIKYSIDVLKFGITTIKKLAMLFAGLKYAKNKGATNLDNLVLKTNGNTQLVQIPDELQKDFEQFCKKHGILMSKLYDLNVSDGKKQYAIDANKADAVFNAFAIDVMEKYKKGSRAEEYKTKMELCGSELKNVYKQYDTAVMLLERMRHGMIENELDALAQALGYKNAEDGAFLSYMEEKYGEVTIDAYLLEGEAYLSELEGKRDWKEKEFLHTKDVYEKELDKTKNPVSFISWEDYINSNRCDLDGFEEIMKRMASGRDEGSYQKEKAPEAFDKNTVDIPESLKDYAYCPDKPDIAIKRTYIPVYDKETGEISGCNHILECEAGGKKLMFDDAGLYGNAYKEGLENFLKEAGLSMEDAFVVIEDERKFKKYQSGDIEGKAEELKKKYERDVLKKAEEGKETGKDTGEPSKTEEKLEANHKESMEKKKAEREQTLRNRDYSYVIKNPEMDVYTVKGDEDILRVNVPMFDGRGNESCILEFQKKDMLKNPDGTLSVCFGKKDSFKMYSYDEIGSDGTIAPGVMPRSIGADKLKRFLGVTLNFKDREAAGPAPRAADSGPKMRKQV